MKFTTLGTMLVFFAILNSCSKHSNPPDDKHDGGLQLVDHSPTDSFGILGDAGRWNDATESSRDAMKERGVNRLILTGDNLYSGDDYDLAWAPWRDFEFPVVAIGNHTLGYEKEVKYFDIPGEYYSKTFHENLKFIVLNSDCQDHLSEQFSWVDQAISEATEQFIFLVLHHPPYKVAKHAWQERQAFQERFRELIKTYPDKISGLITGHDHVTTLIDVGGLPMLVSGASAETRDAKPLSYNDQNDHTPIKTVWLGERVQHWVELNVDSENDSYTFSFINAFTKADVCSIERSNRKYSMSQACSQ